MHSCLAIDVAKGKSMVTLVSSSGEVLINPYEINHSINDFTNLLNRINSFKLDNVSVIMESTGIYHRPIERFFLENNFKVFVINPIYGKMKKRNLRKTKTDKEDCYNLVNLFLSNTFKEYVRPDQLYLDLNALSRQYFALDELCVNIKNRYRNLVYLCFPVRVRLQTAQGLQIVAHGPGPLSVGDQHRGDHQRAPGVGQAGNFQL